MKITNSFLTILLLCSFLDSCTLDGANPETVRKLTDEEWREMSGSSRGSAYGYSDEEIRRELDNCMKLIEYFKTHTYFDEIKLYDNGGARKDTPLMLAEALGDIKSMEDLIKNGATVNKTNNRYGPYGTYNETALHYAAHKGKLEAYAFLLKNGANPDIRDSDGKTAGVILRKTVEDIISGQGNKEFDI